MKIDIEMSPDNFAQSLIDNGEGVQTVIYIVDAFLEKRPHRADLIAKMAINHMEINTAPVSETDEQRYKRENTTADALTALAKILAPNLDQWAVEHFNNELKRRTE